jgi:hypothetical protein
MEDHVKIECYGIYEIFSKRFEPFQNSCKIQSRFASKFYNSKCGEDLVLGEKGKLFYFKLYSVLPSIFIFGQKESCVLHFQTLEHLGDFGKSLDIGKLYTGPSQHQQCSTTPTGAGPRPCQRPAGTAHPTIFSSAPSARVVTHTDRGGSRTRRHWYYSDSATTVMPTDGTMQMLGSSNVFLQDENIK